MIVLGLAALGVKVVASFGFATALPFFFFAGVFGLLFRICLPLIGHLTSTLSYGDDGFTLEKNGEVKSFPWADVSTTRFYALPGVLSLMSRDGRLIYAVYRGANGYREFARRLNKTIGIRS